MKIIEVPAHGPAFRFSDADVYWAMYALSDGRKMGRKRLADEIGIGEGSVRRIIISLREMGFISVSQGGISITRVGTEFLEKTPVRVVDVDMGTSVVGSHSQAVVVKGVADQIENGMQQRDAGIRAGAAGCTTAVYRGGKLMVPPDWNMDEENPETAARIRALEEMGPNDALIVGSGFDRHSAMNAAIEAAFDLL
ncbi:MAG: hypothetical protein GX224_05975 [Thermoplasmatales archaeon]|nr:hypothetical protein [Thermoplasmatales archaeon]